jgi:gamma-glutamylcyclotransferase (GGCT)/AIG2-like uncharacterized protein YtfP
MSETYVFVYGSLKRGEPNAHLMPGVFVGVDHVRGRYSFTGCHQLTEATDGDAVPGELYKVPAASLEDLDRLEGVEYGVYARHWTRLVSGASAWVYFYVYERS